MNRASTHHTIQANFHESVAAVPYTPPSPCYAVWVGGAGNLEVIDEHGNSITYGVQAGLFQGLVISQIGAGTTATGLVAWMTKVP